MSDSVRPHRWQPTRLPRPWDSPGKNTGVGCHFLLPCMNKCLSLCSCASLWAVSTVIFYKSLLFTSNSSPFIKLPHHLQAALPCSESSTLFSRLFCSWLGQCPFPPLMKNWAFCCPHQLTLPLQGHQMPLPALSPFPELQGLSSTSPTWV